MATRTIESPGVEWNEYDLSEVISYAAGTNVVVMGFAHQGPTNQVVEITSKEELMQVFFGNIGPQNAAERYFYHSALEILNTKGKLLCIRLPYGSGKGSGFSTGFVATAFFGEIQNMTSAEAWDWLSQEGGTSAYISKVFEDTPDGERQPVLRLNPTPQSFVLSPDLYQEIKDGAVQWKTPVYQPDEKILQGYSYHFVSGDTPVAPDETWTSGETLAPSAFYTHIIDPDTGKDIGSQVRAFDPSISAFTDITPENFKNVYLSLTEKADTYELIYKNPDRGYKFDANQCAGYEFAVSGGNVFVQVPSGDFGGIVGITASGFKFDTAKTTVYTADDNVPFEYLHEMLQHDSEVQFTSGTEGKIVYTTEVKNLIMTPGANGVVVSLSVADEDNIGDGTTDGEHKPSDENRGKVAFYPFNIFTMKMVDGDNHKIPDREVNRLIRVLKNNVELIFECDPFDVVKAEDDTNGTGKVAKLVFRLKSKDLIFQNYHENKTVEQDGEEHEIEVWKQVFGAHAFKNGRAYFFDGNLAYSEVYNKFENRVELLNGKKEFALTMLTKGKGVLDGINQIVVTMRNGPDEEKGFYKEHIAGIKAVLKPYYTWESTATVVEKLSHAAFFTINQTESSIDEDYQGFYMTVADQDAFVRRGKSIYGTAGLDLLPDGIQALSMDNVDFSESATSAFDKGVEYELAQWPELDDDGKPTGKWISGNPANCPADVKLSAEWVIDEITGEQVIVQGEPLDTPSELVRLQTLQVPTRLLNFPVTGSNSLSQRCVDGLPYVFDRPVYANAIEIAVHRLFTNIENDKLTYATTEMFTGSFNPNATIGTKNGGKENYSLDMMATNHSAYIELYQNTYFERSDHTPILTRFGERMNVYGELTRRADGVCVSLGGYRSCKDENINEYIGNLPAKIDNALLLIDSPLERDIDILIDGGLSTIWGYTYGVGEVMEKVAEDATDLDYNNTGYDAKEFDDTKYISKGLKKILRNLGADGFYNDRAACAIKDSIYSIFTQFDVFCRKTRKDCIFISDPPRFFFVHGEDTKASSKKDWVFSLDMYHPLKNLYEAANSSYSCTYMNWVKKYDNTLADFIWLPMSPFAAEIMCEVDAKYFMWWAPFGLNNGVLSTITDIAFRPNQGQCDYFYKTGFNPVCYFNDGGFVIWGQKTMQDKHSAFDRLNVRRLFLYLERRTVKMLRYYIGEPNTDFTRQRVVDTLTPLYEYCVNNSGLYDYKLKCDAENNPPDIIDDNTLIVDIYLKPVRTIEFILANFYACKTGADFSEIIG